MADAPGSRRESAALPGALATGLQHVGRGASVTMPPADEPISFAQHVKPLFRSKDRDSMTFAFDLWGVDDVRSNADLILGRLMRGTMPCDGGWSADKLELFSRWIVTGKLD